MRPTAPSDRTVRAGAISAVAIAIAVLGIWAQNESLVGVNYDDGIYALVAKAVAGDAGAVPAATALRMATLNGAKALGIDDETGSLVVGKAADITAVRLDALEQHRIGERVVLRFLRNDEEMEVIVTLQ